jgi:antitoxin component of RelBE/YafQ-DinJ toxin-antitoxin module
MSDAALTIRTDIKTKQTIADFAASVGLSTSNFMLAAAMQAVREQRLELAPTLEPTPYLEKIMRKAVADRAKGQNVSTFTNKADAIAHLRSL